MKIIAIDPGASGGIAWLCQDGYIFAAAMPATEGDVLAQLTSLQAANGFPKRVIIEDVGGFCGVGQPGSAMFKFGRGFGFILGVCAALGWRVELVKPQKWQKTLGLGTKALAGGKGPWKNKLKALAQQLFPTCDVTLKTADALLMLEYGNHQNQRSGL